MQPSADGLVPMTGFLENAMAPRPSFNDHTAPNGKWALDLDWELLLTLCSSTPSIQERGQVDVGQSENTSQRIFSTYPLRHPRVFPLA